MKCYIQDIIYIEDSIETIYRALEHSTTPKEKCLFLDELTNKSNKYYDYFNDGIPLFYDSAPRSYNNIYINRMFYTMCDILSIDFDCVAQNLYVILCNEILQGNDSLTVAENIMETLLDIHPCICTVDNLKCLSEIYQNMKLILKDDVILEPSLFQSGEYYFAKDEYLDCYNRFNSHDDFYKLESKVIKDIDKHFCHHLRDIAKYVDRLNELDILKSPDSFRLYNSAVLNERLLEFTTALSENDKLNGQTLSFDYFVNLLNHEDNKHIEVSCNSVIEFICANIYYILTHGMTIKCCENCGKFFVAYNRSDTLYCDRKSPQEKEWSCKEYVSKRGWYEKQRENEAAKLYRNIYQKKQMYLRRHPDLEKYKKDFEEFKTAAKEWKKNIKNGTAAESDYLQWLKEVK